MPVNRVLLFYISVNSGHQMAAMAIEDSIRALDRNIETLNINYFRYTNPVLADLIMKTYHGMLKRKPELWDYLYDNDDVKGKIEKFRNIIHKINSVKLYKLIEWYKPDIIVCTQAFPCVAMAEYKKIHKCAIPVIGVVTDYGVHSYWADNGVNGYFVPNREGKDRLITLGIDRDKVDIIGIPILHKFSMPLDEKKIKNRLGLDNNRQVVLVMGGSQGMISMDEIVKNLIKLPLSFNIIVVCGVNKKLYKKLNNIRNANSARLKLYQYVNNVDELMAVSDLIVTKPGGLTVTESLAKALPIIIINPIPGQEMKNTEFLIKNNAAVKARDARDVSRRVGDLLTNPAVLREMKQSVSSLAMPRAAFEIAGKIINWGN